MNKHWGLETKEHVPAVLTKEALEEMRLIALYPSAADLLATVDSLMARIEELERLCLNAQAVAIERGNQVLDMQLRLATPRPSGLGAGDPFTIGGGPSLRNSEGLNRYPGHSRDVAED